MNMRQDLILAGRRMRRSPGFAAVVVLTLALGIGAATAVFSVAESVLLRGLPYEEPDRIVQLSEATELEPEDQRELSWPDYLDLKGTEGVFERIGGYGYSGGFRFDTEEGPSLLEGAMVTVDFFTVLGVEPVIGRNFLPAEEEPGSDRVALISHALWISRFGESRDVLGTALLADDTPVEIVGVLPAGFHFAPSGSADVWVAMVPSESQRERRYMHWIKPVARLAPGVTIDHARDALAGLASGFHEPDPTRGRTTIALIPISERIVGRMDTIVKALLAAAGLVLLITCVNVASLLIARSTDREAEIATRSALGGTRGRIIRQFLVESIVLGTLGAASGIWIAGRGVSWLIGAIPDEIRAAMPYLGDAGINTRVLLFAIAVTLAATVFFGTSTALQAFRASSVNALHSGTRVASSSQLRRLLVALEIGLSLALVIGTGLLIRSALAVADVDPGFDRENLLTMRVELPDAGYEEQEQRMAFFDRVLETIESRPGVDSAALVSKLPLTGFGNTGGPQLVGYPEPAERISANLRGISAGYFETMDIPFLSGRDFSRDDTEERPFVAIANEKLAKGLLPDGDVIGKKVRFVFMEDEVEIIGVVGDENVGSLDADPAPTLYFAFRQEPGPSWFIVTRTSVDPDRLAPGLANDVRGIEPRALVHSVRSMDRIVASSSALFLRRYPLTLLGTFSLIAVVLAAIGIYGIVAYSVSSRTRELGIRLALGADGVRLLRLILGDASHLAILGAGLGLALAFPMTGLLSSLLFAVGSRDPITWVTGTSVLLAVAIAASLAPALRAARTNPASALRHE